MRKSAWKLSLCTTGVVLGMVSSARAVITIDGSLDSDYGAAKAVQTNNISTNVTNSPNAGGDAAGFLDNTDASGVTANGSELDAAYGVVQGGTLNLLFTGNFATNYTHLNVYIADGPGQNTLAMGTAGGAALWHENGSVFSPGFNATYALDINGGAGSSPTFYINQYDLTATNRSGNYLGSLTPTAAGQSATIGTPGTSAIGFGVNNSNIAGVTATGPSAANATAAGAVTTGIELQIPLSYLGSPTGNISVLALIAGQNDQFLSNQFLTGLPTAVDNVGVGGTAYSGTSPATFNFSATPNQFFTVAVPSTGAILGVWNAAGGGSWNTLTNWLGGVPHSAGDHATFGNSTAAATVTLDGSKTVGQITFNKATSYTIAAGTPSTSVLTIDDSGATGQNNPTISVNVGSHFITAGMAIPAGMTVNTLDGTSLKISGNITGGAPISKIGGGNLTLAGANSYTGTTTVLAGSMELDSNAGASTGEIDLGDPTADALPVALNIGVSGINVSNPIVTNKDLASNNNLRSIAGTYATGSATVSGPITINGGVNLSAASGATLVVSGAISDGTDTTASINHDIVVSGTGTVTLSGASTFSGFTNVGAGATANITGTMGGLSGLSSGGNTNLGANTGTGILVRAFAGVFVGNGATGSGKITVMAPSATANRTVLVTSGLTLGGTTDAWTGLLDLTKNDLIVTGGDPVQIENQIKQAYNGGAWTGSAGITSSSAAGSSPKTALGYELNDNGSGTALVNTFDGQSVFNNDVIVKYTLAGDANLDGSVNFSDLLILAQNYSKTGTVWNTGDFNYDGTTNFSDLLSIAQNYNKGLSLSASQMSQLDAVGGSSFAAAFAQAEAQVAIPEPGSLALIGVAAAGMLGRRRRAAR